VVGDWSSDVCSSDLLYVGVNLFLNPRNSARADLDGFRKLASLYEAAEMIPAVWDTALLNLGQGEKPHRRRT